MIMRLILATAVFGAAFALPAQAQFRMDLAPSAFRAANAPPKPDQDPVSGRINALSPLGGKQGTPVNKPVTAAIKPVEAYAGVPSDASTDTFNQRPGVGATSGKIDDPTVDDPNKPRKPLAPASLKKGVAPRH